MRCNAQTGQVRAVNDGSGDARDDSRSASVLDQAFVGSVDSRKVSGSEGDVFVNGSILSAR